MINACIVHYGEIALKGRNRSYFEKRLSTNIKRALSGVDFGEIKRLRGRFLIELSDQVTPQQIESALQRVFGIANFNLCLTVDADIEVFEVTAWEMLQPLEFDSFKVEARRAEKDFHLNSMEINQRVGAFIQAKCGKRVDLTHPDVTLYIELIGRKAYFSTKKIQGLHGLPIGVSEKAVSLLSSGIDSPVASYLMLKRGVDLIYVHFHSQPFTNQASKDNAERLVQQLNGFQLRNKVYFIPFIDIQKEIMAHAPESLRVILYRRYMVRIAERIAEMEKAKALVTGESVGQVASQTLSNIRVVAEVTQLPILRPLSGFDKDEIVAKAKEIGTFDISIQPYEDCCTLFVPQNVETKAKPWKVKQAEENLKMEELMQATMANAEIKTFRL